MRAAVVVALTISCFAAQGQVQAGGAAAQSPEDTLAVAACETHENIEDQMRLSAAEHSHSGLPVSEKVWKLAMEIYKGEIEERTWAWFQERVDAPGAIAALREAHPDFGVSHLELVRVGMAFDEYVAADASVGAPTADDLALSVEHWLMRQESAEGIAFSQVAVVAQHVSGPHWAKDPAVWTTFATTLRPHENVYESFGYGTFDLLRAVYAVSDNELVMKAHHMDSYNLLNMAGYRVAQQLMLDTMMNVASACVTGESCGESELCEDWQEIGAQTCETAAHFCRANQQAERLGLCDALPRRCEYAVACVDRTAQGAGADGNCIVDSWEALRSSGVPSLLEDVASNAGEASAR